jgi:hypothetical protein
MNQNKKLEKRLNENLVSVVQKMAETKVSNFKKRYKEAMGFVSQNWFVIKDTVGPLYGMAIALIAGLSNQPVSHIAKKLKQK